MRKKRSCKKRKKLEEPDARPNEAGINQRVIYCIYLFCFKSFVGNEDVSDHLSETKMFKYLMRMKMSQISISELKI